jgi:hypothetical protein
LPPKKPATAPSKVPMTVALKAAARPTKTEISVPLMVLSSTSRPRRSAPKGRVAVFTVSTVL